MEREQWEVLRDVGVYVAKIADALAGLAYEWENNSTEEERLPFLEQIQTAFGDIRREVHSIEQVSCPPPGFSPKQWALTLLLEAHEATYTAEYASDPKLIKRLGREFADRVNREAKVLRSRSNWLINHASYERIRADGNIGLSLPLDDEDESGGRAATAAHYLDWEPQYRREHPKNKSTRFYHEFVQQFGCQYPGLTPRNLSAAVSRLRRLQAHE